MHEDSQRIKTMLVCNGFPENFLDDGVRNFLYRLYALRRVARGGSNGGNCPPQFRKLHQKFLGQSSLWCVSQRNISA